MTSLRSRLISRETQFALDLIVLAGAFWLAYLLRFEFRFSVSNWSNFGFQLPLVILIQFAALHFSGAYSFVWRYVGMAEIRTFMLAGLYSFVFLILLRLFLPPALAAWRVPFSIIVMDAIWAFGGVVGLRFARRWVYEKYQKSISSSTQTRTHPVPVLLVGAGQAGLMAAKEISGRGNLGLEIKGFVDDDPRKQGLRAAGQGQRLQQFHRHRVKLANDGAPLQNQLIQVHPWVVGSGVGSVMRNHKVPLFAPTMKSEDRGQGKHVRLLARTRRGSPAGPR